MDWERTKTLFILAFLMLNTLFAFQLWVVPNYFDTAMQVSPQQIEAKLTQLRYRNISVTTEVPRQLQRLRMLVIDGQDVDHKKRATSILGPNAVHVVTSISPAPGHSRFQAEMGEVFIYNDGRVVFVASPNQGEPATETQAKDKATQFLRQTLGMPREASITNILEQENGTWVLEFGHRWRRRNLEVSRIKVLVDGSGVRHMDYYWANVAGFAGQDIVTIPAAGALLVAADSMPAGTTVTDIYYSWYSRPLVAEQWRVPPVWVIKTDLGMVYYINAFTGDLEGKEDISAGKTDPVLN